MRPQKILLVLVLNILLGIPVCPFHAIAGYINFDNLTPPSPTPLVLPGATFTPGVNPGVSTSGSVSADPLAPTPPNNYQVNLNNLYFEPDIYTVATITFDKPVSLVSFQMYCNWSSSLGLNNFAVAALGNSGNMLDNQVLFIPTQLQMNRILLSAEEIKSVVIKVHVSSGSSPEKSISVAIDNFCFYSLRPTAAVIPLF